MKSHLIHLVIVLMTGIAVLIGYGFWYATIASKSAAVANLQSQIIAKTETMSRIASARASLAEIADAEATVQSYFVPETGMVTFIDGLETQAKTQGATTSVLSVSTGVINTQPIFTLALAITGAFDAVLSTVGAIEYAPYDLSVSGLSLVQNGKNSWQANLNLTVGSIQTATSTP